MTLKHVAFPFSSSTTAVPNFCFCATDECQTIFSMQWLALLAHSHLEGPRFESVQGCFFFWTGKSGRRCTLLILSVCPGTKRPTDRFGSTARGLGTTVLKATLNILSMPGHYLAVCFNAKERKDRALSLEATKLASNLSSNLVPISSDPC